MPISKNIREQSEETVKVVVRCRPMSEKELKNEFINIVKMPSKEIVQLYDPKYEILNQCKSFTFDRVYDSGCSQQEIYDQVVRPLVTSVLNGFNCTVFAYGQSGTGKTYTMEGKEDKENNSGLIFKSFQQIFDNISRSCNMQYLVRMSYLEIYQDEIKDLLNKNTNVRYELRENKDLGVYVKNIRSFICKSAKQMNEMMNAGRRNRTIGTTDINARSSRSHAIVTITVEMKSVEETVENTIRVGKLNLVDLAGSERQNKTNSEGKRLREANKINLSLTALGNVISALAENKNQYIPYRDSKLTRLLKDSLGGNSRTLMIANIGPSNYNYDETLNTLRYASRARNIKNEPKVNEDPIDALLKKYQEEITRLKSQLAERTTKIKRMKSENRRKTEIRVHASTKNAIDSQLDSDSNSLPSEDNICCTEEKQCEVRDYSEIEKKENVEELLRRIESMESRLLTGTSSILLHTSEQRRAIEEQANEIEKSIEREKEMQDMLVQQEGTAEGLRGVYENLKQEVEMKYKSLINAYHKLQSTQAEINDSIEEFNSDRRELEVMKYELLKDLKLSLLIMENFIPQEERRRLLSRLHFDEEQDTWNLQSDCEFTHNIPKPKCSDHIRRPESLYTVITRRKANHIYRCDKTPENRMNMFRLKGEHILELELVEAPQTTKDYRRATMSTAFRKALQVEEDIDIDAANISNRINLPGILDGEMEHKIYLRNKKDMRKGLLPILYPKSRGLVPK